MGPRLGGEDRAGSMRLIGEELGCRRGDRAVFAGLDFDVAADELLVLRGANGSGKTSLLRMIAGLVEPAAGRLRLEGGLVDAGIAGQCHFVGHQDALKPALTARENLGFWGDFLGGGDVAAGLAAFDLTAIAGVQAGLLSAGLKRRLALSRLALVHRPLWLLDEPTVGLDSASQERFAALMRAHLGGGGLIIAATHVDIGLDATRTIDLGRLAAVAP
jgi:heme exporter protein A